jgi:hypothetical protein
MTKPMQFIGYLAITAFALSLTALANDTHSGNFTLDDTVQVGSTQLSPGDYKAEWSGPANDLKIDILQHGKTVATTEGTIKDLPKPAPYNAVMVKPTADHEKTVREIDFNHRSEALVLGGE